MTNQQIVPTVEGVSTELVEALCRVGPEWLLQSRRAAWDAFLALPMPSSQRDEDWRRTDVSRVTLDNALLALSDKSAMAVARQMASRVMPEAAVATVGPDGVQLEIPDALAAQGVIICSLADASLRHSDLLQRALASIAIGESKFLALWSALQNHGVFVYVPNGVSALAPLWIAHTAQGQSGNNSLTLPASVILLGQNAELTAVESFASTTSENALVSVGVSLIQLGDDASLDYNLLQCWGRNVNHFATHRARLAQGARLHFFGATLGSRLQKSYWEVSLEGDGSEADLVGLALGKGSQHLDHQSLQEHRGRDTRSNLLLKVAVSDQARSVYSGMIDVAKGAIHTDGYVQNRNLILSHDAVADSIPRLQIKANDVKCGHGSTAGHIDDEQRFYLQARGVSREEADRIIVRGFLDDALSHVRQDRLREYLAELLEAEIEDDRLGG